VRNEKIRYSINIISRLSLANVGRYENCVPTRDKPVSRVITEVSCLNDGPGASRNTGMFVGRGT